MAEKFDPLHKWLGIHPKDQPPHYYRLLGLEQFESDPDIIDAAAKRVTTFVETCVDGPHGKVAQKLLKALAQVRGCLLDPKSRAAYDAKLRSLAQAPAKTTADKATADKATADKTTPAKPVPGGAKKVARTASAVPAPPPPPQEVAAPEPAVANRAGTVRVARPIASPPPPPPPQAPVPPPADEPEAPAWSPLEEIAPEPYTSRRSKKPSRRGAKPAQAEVADGEETPPRRRFGLKAALVGFIGLGGVVAVVAVCIAMFPGKPAKEKPQSLAKSVQAEPDAEAANAEKGNGEKNAAGEKAAELAGQPAEADKAAGTGVALKADAAGLAVAQDAASAADAQNGSQEVVASESLLKLARNGGPIDQLNAELAAGASVDSVDSAGRSLLRLAVMEGHFDFVEALLDKNAKVDSLDKLGETALMSAAQKGNERMVARLLNASANPSLQSRIDSTRLTGGLTALLVAVRHGHQEVFKQLMDAGADVNTANARGVTPLMVACWQAQAPMVQLLLIKQAKVEAADNEGQTAIMYAVEGGSEDILKQLLFNGDIRISTKSKTGTTALGIAVSRRAAAMAVMLREAVKKEAPALDF